MISLEGPSHPSTKTFVLQPLAGPRKLNILFSEPSCEKQVDVESQNVPRIWKQGYQTVWKTMENLVAVLKDKA